MSFNSIRPKILNYQIESSEEIVKKLIPEPDPKILERLISHHSGTNIPFVCHGQQHLKLDIMI